MKLEEATGSQRAAILSTSANICMLASPGSGKTATSVARVAHLISLGVPPDKIASITFTNAGAREFSERITGLDPGLAEGDGPQLGACSTLHSFALRMLREVGTAFGYGERTSIISPEASQDLLESTARKFGCKTPIKTLVALKSSGAWIGKSDPRMGQDLIVVRSFLEDLKIAGVVDYDVILQEFLRMLTEDTPEAMSAQMAIGDRFTHLIVDEAQDSAPIDWRIYRALPMRFKQYVGDIRQAIFGFRGGDVREMVRECQQPGTELVLLRENFRSAPEICAAANRLIAHNNDGIAGEIVPTRPAGGTVRELPPFATESDEVLGVGNAVRAITESDPSATVAILARTNAVAQGFRRPLESWGLPVVSVEKKSLPPGWATARAFVDFVINPENDALAYFYLVAKLTASGMPAKNAKAVAHEQRRAAQAKGVSVNSEHIGHGRITDPKFIPQALASQPVSREAQYLVAEKLRELPPCSTVVDLALSMAQAHEWTKEGEEGRVHVLTIHCSPADEPVLTTIGYVPIAQLCPGFHRLLSFVGTTGLFQRGKNSKNPAGAGYDFRIKTRYYSGTMLTITTSASRTRVTPEHRIRVRYSESFYGKWIVYLMRRGEWWRIGLCTSGRVKPYVSGGLSGRLATEKGDDGWILSVHESRTDALVAEAEAQVRYGIPGFCFEPYGHTGTRLELHAIHDRLRPMVTERVKILFADTGLLPDGPLYHRIPGKKAMMRHGTWFDTVAANLIPGFMEIPTVDANSFDEGSKKPIALPVTVEKTPFGGDVFSLDVIPLQYYISGGAVVHNSAKGREFDHVFLVGFEEEAIPGRNTGEDGELEEERRLAFVAVTRARQSVTISWAASRMMEWRGATKRNPSRFIREILP